MVTLDWHGFSRLAPKPTKKLGKVIAVPMPRLLGGASIDSWAPLEGNEEALLVWTVQFKLVAGRYICAGCPICRPDELERRLRAVGEAAAESVIRSLLAPSGFLRRQWAREVAKIRTAILVPKRRRK